MREYHLPRPRSFLSHPLPECSCRTVKSAEISQLEKGSNLHTLYKNQDECPKSLEVNLKAAGSLKENAVDETESEDDDVGLGLELEESSQIDAVTSAEQDEEMDPDD